MSWKTSFLYRETGDQWETFDVSAVIWFTVDNFQALRVDETRIVPIVWHKTKGHFVRKSYFYIMVIVILFKHAQNSDGHNKINCMVMLNFFKKKFVWSNICTVCYVSRHNGRVVEVFNLGVEMLPLKLCALMTYFYFFPLGKIIICTWLLLFRSK